MKLKELLEKISDEQGPMQTMAADLIDSMTKVDFTELCADMKKLSADTWAEKEGIR